MGNLQSVTGFRVETESGHSIQPYGKTQITGPCPLSIAVTIAGRAAHQLEIPAMEIAGQSETRIMNQSFFNIITDSDHSFQALVNHCREVQGKHQVLVPFEIGAETGSRIDRRQSRAHGISGALFIAVGIQITGGNNPVVSDLVGKCRIPAVDQFVGDTRLTDSFTAAGHLLVMPVVAAEVQQKIGRERQIRKRRETEDCPQIADMIESGGPVKMEIPVVFKSHPFINLRVASGLQTVLQTETDEILTFI